MTARSYQKSHADELAKAEARLFSWCLISGCLGFVIGVLVMAVWGCK